MAKSPLEALLAAKEERRSSSLYIQPQGMLLTKNYTFCSGFVVSW